MARTSAADRRSARSTTEGFRVSQELARPRPRGRHPTMPFCCRTPHCSSSSRRRVPGRAARRRRARQARRRGARRAGGGAPARRAGTPVDARPGTPVDAALGRGDAAAAGKGRRDLRRCRGLTTRRRGAERRGAARRGHGPEFAARRRRRRCRRPRGGVCRRPVEVRAAGGDRRRRRVAAAGAQLRRLCLPRGDGKGGDAARAGRLPNVTVLGGGRVRRPRGARRDLRLLKTYGRCRAAIRRPRRSLRRRTRFAVTWSNGGTRFRDVISSTVHQHGSGQPNNGTTSHARRR